MKKSRGDFKGALADAARAIDVDSKSGWSSYQRGCFRYENREWTEALEDFRQALGKEALLEDYAQIRIYFVLARHGDEPSARAALAEYRKKRPAKNVDWPEKVLSHLTGELAEKDFLATAPSTSKKCEAYYYAGTSRLIAGDKAGATELFRKCVETVHKVHFEYRTAEAELEAMKKGK